MWIISTHKMYYHLVALAEYVSIRYRKLNNYPGFKLTSFV